MKRYPESLFILLCLLVLTLLWAGIREREKPYRKYQRTYRVRQIAALKKSLTAGLPAEEAEKTRGQIRALQGETSRVRELHLPGGKTERCLSCHDGIEEISASHPVQTFGCTLCHGGDPLSVTLPAAHQGLIGGRNPSDFRVIDRSCGRTLADGTACHNGAPKRERNHIARVKTTIMATKAGETALVRYSFGLQKRLEPLYGTTAIRGKDAEEREGVLVSLEPLPYGATGDLPVDAAGKPVARDPTGVPYRFSGRKMDTQLHRNCLNRCHLWTAGEPRPYLARASGCASCHYLYDDQAYYRGNDPTISRTEPGHGAFHRLTRKIPYSQCNHCHNRGVHSLQRMEFDERSDLSGGGEHTGSERRELDYYNPMTLYTRCEIELDCIDCHTDEEVMGDGFLYRDKIAQQKIRCFTCHGTLERPPEVRTLSREESPKVQRIMKTYGRQPGEPALFTKEGEILPHVRVEGVRLLLRGKVTEKEFRIPLVYGSACRQESGKQEANACHGCHDVHREKK